MATGTALVTGATAGIGAAFADRLAAEGHDVVLVARDEGRLRAAAHELRGRYNVLVDVLPADLSTEEGQAAVAARLADPDRPVEVLVNNAGFSLNTSFLRSTVDDEERLLRLNVNAVMRLTHAALGGMTSRRRGAIINVSSVAGFGVAMPGSTYPASKAWVTSFTESVAMSAARFDVRLMALCPGYTRTGYHERAGVDMSRLPGWLWLDSDELVRDALRDLRRGKVVSVPDWKYKIVAFSLRHLPRRMIRMGARDTRGA